MPPLKHGIYVWGSQREVQIQVLCTFYHTGKYYIKSNRRLLLLISYWSKIWHDKLNACNKRENFHPDSTNGVKKGVLQKRKKIKIKIPLFICSSPIPHLFSASTHANVHNTASLTNQEGQLWRPQEPSLTWLSNNQFMHCGKQGACGNSRDGTIATHAVSYGEKDSSILSNIFSILSLVLWKHCKHSEQSVFSIQCHRIYKMKTKQWRARSRTRLLVLASVPNFDPWFAVPDW